MANRIKRWNGSTWVVIYDESALATLSFSTIAVSGQSNVVADAPGDTLTLAAGNGITITTNAGTDTITIANTTPESIPFGFPGSLTVKTSGMKWRPPYNITITNISVEVGTAPSGVSANFDVLKNGSTLWGTNPSNKPSIAAGQTTDLTSTPDTTSVTTTDYLQVGCTQTGSAADAVITVFYTRA